LCLFQFLVYFTGFSFFFVGQGSVCPSGYAGLSQEWLWKYLCRLFAHLMVASPKEVWSQCLVAWEPSCFLSVMWRGEALHWLGVQDVIVLLLLGVFFLLCVTPASQQDF
jgi:hypothetical protein